MRYGIVMLVAALAVMIALWDRMPIAFRLGYSALLFFFIGYLLGDAGYPVKDMPRENATREVKSVDIDVNYVFLTLYTPGKGYRQYYRIKKENIEDLNNLSPGKTIKNIYGKIKICQ